MKFIKKYFGIIIFMVTSLINFNFVHAKSIDVSTFSQFESAIMDSSVSNINVTKSIVFEDFIPYLPPDRTLTINGNSDEGVIIDAGKFYLVNDPTSSKSKISITNANIKTEYSTTKRYCFIEDNHGGTEFYIKNVDFYGSTFIVANNSKIIIDGNNTMNTSWSNLQCQQVVFSPNSNYFSTSLSGGISLSHLEDYNNITLEENAKAYFHQKNYSSAALANGDNLIIKNGALLDIVSTGSGLAAFKNTTIENGGTIRISQLSLDDIPANYYNYMTYPLSINFDSTLNLNPGSSLYVFAKNNHAIYFGSEKINFNNPKNLVISSFGNKYKAIQHYIGTQLNFNFGDKIYLWHNKNTANPYEFSTVKGTLDSTPTGERLTSNNKNYNSAFELNYLSKIATTNEYNYKFTVIFDSNNESQSIVEKSVSIDEKLTPISNPQRKGYIFDGWFTDKSYTTKWDFDSAINSNLYLVAKWIKIETSKFMVTFNSDNNSTQIYTQSINIGEKAIEPTTPLKENHTFDGWFTDKEYKIKWDFNTIVTSDLNLIAKWRQDSIGNLKVTFNANGGINTPKDQNVLWSEKITEPPQPTREDYIFEGWSRNILDSKAWDFNKDIVTGNLTLYAIWSKPNNQQLFTVTFDSRGGTAVKPIYNVKSGSTIKMPAVPKKANNVFGGWYADKDFTVRWIFSKSKVYDNITLYGWWSRDN